MHVNYEYLLSRCKQVSSTAKILDYGCGAGNIVEQGIREGIDLYGVDVFYDGGNTREQTKEKGLFDHKIFEIKNNRIPFEQETFDLVISNQVFEHVENLDTVLKEIHRVLKPGGLFLTMFPSKEVWREGHCGIPFWHWSKGQGLFRYLYGRTWRLFGFGYHTENKTAKQWTLDFMYWLDQYTFYRTQKEITADFSKLFETHFNEKDYLKYRLQFSNRKTLAKLLDIPPFNLIGVFFMRKLQSLLIEARKATH